MPATSCFPRTELQGRVAPKLLQKARFALQTLHDEEDGMNTVEAIILLFVAAIVLLVFFTVIWPEISGAVMTQLRSLFGQTGGQP